MGISNLIKKYGKPDTKGWFSDKEVSCSGCMFDTGDPKYCLIYLEEAGKEKPMEKCKHKKTFERGAIK